MHEHVSVGSCVMYDSCVEVRGQLPIVIFLHPPRSTMWVLCNKLGWSGLLARTFTHRPIWQVLDGVYLQIYSAKLNAGNYSHPGGAEAKSPDCCSRGPGFQNSSPLYVNNGEEEPKCRGYKYEPLYGDCFTYFFFFWMQGFTKLPRLSLLPLPQGYLRLQTCSIRTGLISCK